MLNEVYRDRRIDPLYIGLFNKNLSGLRAKSLHFGLLDDLASTQLFYLTVQVTHL